MCIQLCYFVVFFLGGGRVVLRFGHCCVYFVVCLWRVGVQCHVGISCQCVYNHVYFIVLL